MPDRILKPDSGNDLVLQNDDASAKIEINENASIPVTGTLDVSGATLTTSSAQKQAIVQAGPGSGTLDVSSGTFTTSSAQKTAIVDGGKGNLTASDVGLGNVTNESKATMFTSPTFTGNTALGSNATGTFNGSIGSSATFPAGHVIQVKRNNIAMTSQDYNQFSFSSSTPAVPSLSSNNLEVTGFSASSGNIIFVTWNYGLAETADSNVILTGFKVGSTFYATNFFQGGTSSNGLGRYNCVVTGSITLGSALTNATISAAVSAPNSTSSRLLHYAYTSGSPTHLPSITVMEIKQ